MTQRTMRTMILALAISGSALALLSACEKDPGPDPIIGDWVLKDRVCDEYAELEVEDDLEGTATIYFYYEGSCYYADFDFEVDVDKRGRDYVFDMECDGDCGDLDFEMECELDGDDLECEGDEMWSDWDFEWERD